MVPLTSLLAVQLFLRRQWNRSRVLKAATGTTPSWPGLDSEFYRIERRLRDAGIDRHPQETLSALMRRARTVPVPGSKELEAALALHYRLRFDPAGLAPEERAELRRRVEAWESATASSA